MNDQRQRIVSKLHVPQWAADQVHDLWPKGAFLLARLVMEEAIKPTNGDRRPESIEACFYSDEALAADMPYGNNTFTPKDLRDLNRDSILIRDWLTHRSTLPVAVQEHINLKISTKDELLQRSKDWHKTLKVKRNIGKRSDEKNAHVFLEFDNGWYWVNLKASYSHEEANAMGHCGNDNGHELISLRDQDGNSYLTLSWKKETQEANQFRGRHNTLPSKKYDYYIFKLFEQTTYPIRGFKSDAFPFDIMRKYAFDLFQIEHIRELIMRSEKFMMSVYAAMDFQGISERDIMRLFVRYHDQSLSLSAHTNRDMNIWRKATKNNLHTKPWFDWTFCSLDVAKDPTSTLEDLERLVESNWFNINDDLGTYKKKRGTLATNLLSAGKLDMFLHLLETYPDLRKTMELPSLESFDHVVVKRQGEYSQHLIEDGAKSSPFYFGSDWDGSIIAGTKNISIILANYCTQGNAKALMLFKSIGIDLSLAVNNVFKKNDHKRTPKKNKALKAVKGTKTSKSPSALEAYISLGIRLSDFSDYFEEVKVDNQHMNTSTFIHLPETYIDTDGKTCIVEGTDALLLRAFNTYLKKLERSSNYLQKKYGLKKSPGFSSQQIEDRYHIIEDRLVAIDACLEALYNKQAPDRSSRMSRELLNTARIQRQKDKEEREKQLEIERDRKARKQFDNILKAADDLIPNKHTTAYETIIRSACRLLISHKPEDILWVAEHELALARLIASCTGATNRKTIIGTLFYENRNPTRTMLRVLVHSLFDHRNTFFSDITRYICNRDDITRINTTDGFTDVFTNINHTWKNKNGKQYRGNILGMFATRRWEVKYLQTVITLSSSPMRNYIHIDILDNGVYRPLEINEIGCKVSYGKSLEMRNTMEAQTTKKATKKTSKTR